MILKVRWPDAEVLAWRYGGSEELPDWAKFIRNSEGDLVVDRRTGRQVMHVGEWLVKWPGCDVEWMTNEMVQKDFVVPEGV